MKYIAAVFAVILVAVVSAGMKNFGRKEKEFNYSDMEHVQFLIFHFNLSCSMRVRCVFSRLIFVGH